MTLPPSFPPPVRPELADRLLAAVAERDQPMADRLVQQWVHRRGLEALEALMAGPLLASQGPEAVLWLQERSGAAPLGVVPTQQQEPEWTSDSVETVDQQIVDQGLEPVVAQLVERRVEHRDGHGVESLLAANPSRSWPQLAVVPDGEPAPTPRALAPLRAWLPAADVLPQAS